MKHTPGPWEVYFDGDGCHVGFTKGPSVWDTTEDNPDSLKDVAELKANARLIATAPEMLEALKHVEQWSRCDDRMDRASMIAVVTRAIKKATGDD